VTLLESGVQSFSFTTPLSFAHTSMAEWSWAKPTPIGHWPVMGVKMLPKFDKNYMAYSPMEQF